MSGSNTRNRMTAVVLGGVALGMVGAAYAAVPLYRIFCQVTGYGGTTQRVAETDAAPAVVSDRTITVRFNSDKARDLDWRFKPEQREITVKVGETALAFFRATNNGIATITGTASYNVTPDKVGIYFNKVECFCFTEQTLAPGQTAEMPVSFFVDPDIVNDPNLDDVNTITLSYTFFKLRDEDGKGKAAGPAASRDSGGDRTSFAAAREAARQGGNS